MTHSSDFAVDFRSQDFDCILYCTNELTSVVVSGSVFVFRKRSRSSSPEEDSDERRRKFLERNRSADKTCVCVVCVCLCACANMHDVFCVCYGTVTVRCVV